MHSLRLASEIDDLNQAYKMHARNQVATYRTISADLSKYLYFAKENMTSEIHGHKFHFGDEASHSAVSIALDDCVWRIAKPIDGAIYWVTQDGGIGDRVTDGNFKIQHFGDFIGLAPITEEPDSGLDERTRVRK